MRKRSYLNAAAQLTKLIISKTPKKLQPGQTWILTNFNHCYFLLNIEIAQDLQIACFSSCGEMTSILLEVA